MRTMNIVFIILTIIFAAVTVFLGLQLLTRESNSHSSSELGNATFDPDETYFLNVNYYSNENKDGRYVFEVSINYYNTASSSASIIGTGVQFTVAPVFGKEIVRSGDGFLSNVGDFLNDIGGFTNTFYRERIANNSRDFMYFNKSVEGVGYERSNALSSLDTWLYDISGTFIKVTQNSKSFPFETTWFANRYLMMDVTYLMHYLYNVVQGLDYGQQVLTLDMSGFFRLFKNGANNNFEVELTGRDTNYIFVKTAINKSSSGITKASDSLFKNFNGDAAFNLYPVPGVSFSSFSSTVTLTAAALNFKDIEGASYAYINESVISFLESLPNRFNVVLNLIRYDNVLLSNGLFLYGLDHNFLRGLEVSHITITSNSSFSNELLHVFSDSLSNFYPDFLTLNNLQLVVQAQGV